MVTALCAAGAVGALIFARSFRRRGERGWAISVLSYLSIAPSLLWLFPDRSEIASGVVCIIAYGDGPATLVGMLVGGPRLPWNAAKTWAGSTAFVAGSLPFAVFAFWLQSRPAIPLAASFICVAPAVLLGAIAESLPMRINDNIRVSLVASAALIVMQALVVGR